MPKLLALLAIALLVGCAPVTSRPRFPASAADAVFVPATLEEAANAEDFHVARPNYLPAGLRFDSLDYSVRRDHQFVVQRYSRGDDNILYVLAERFERWLPPPPPDPNLPPDPLTNELSIHGREALLTALRLPDGGIAEWDLDWEENGLHYTVGGPFPAEEIIAVAQSLR